MFELSKMSHFETRSISAENFRGEKGRGGMAVHGAAERAARDLGQGWKVSPYIVLEPGKTFELASIDGPGIIKHIWITDSCPKNRKIIIRMYWDGSEKPSVEVPLGDFFASAEYREYAQITSIPVCVNPKRAFNCYWDMPFYKKCRITLESLHDEAVQVYYQIDYLVGELEPGHGYFHAQFRRTNPLPYKQEYTILDNASGNGHYVGTYMYWGSNSNGWWGEGEIKFFLDGDKEFPTICGTGTEDYFGGAWCFEGKDKYETYMTPYSGMPMISKPDGMYCSQQRFSLYRWHITDPIYFKKDIKVTIQALGWRDGGRYLPLQDDLSSVAFWYQDTICESFPKLPSVDELEII